MNKQQLAKKIWQSANEMRGKIEANEYKDYILGLMFYKFVSEKEVKFLIEQGMSEEDIRALTETSDERDFIQSNLGYFIAYDNLFSTWLEMGRDFSVDNVHIAISAFERLIKKNPEGQPGRSPYQRVFEGIFSTLDTGLSKLGDNATKQSKAIREIVGIIKDIPMDSDSGYDVLGYVYEYLINNFAANAGKKAGEFYTPFEASQLMSIIIADHLKDKEQISIYDGCSGSGSLLINIGKATAKYVNGDNNIKYYAQELKANTYNLTRMNLVMRGILPENIEVRNADTLEEDWPVFDNDDPNQYRTLRLDGVVGNPPYSQKWNPTDKAGDPRYAEYGLAPKGKADYAFLLHDLYHIKPDGIMTIVLPHGVLFRGGEEGEIRKNLIENNNIDAIIGLPANMFFGTGIPTIIMVLKKNRPTTDVLIVDASKGFVKDGNKNLLRSRDVKKIADTVIARESIDKFSRVVSKEEIVENDYNLNIPRYVDSSEPTESWDIYASMFGGIPQSEAKALDAFWRAFPTLKAELFDNADAPFMTLTAENVKEVVNNNADVKAFTEACADKFSDFSDYLNAQIVEHMSEINIYQKKDEIAQDIFSRVQDLPLVDKYEAFQIFDDEWKTISNDLEMIQTEGKEAISQVDQAYKIKKEDGKDVEVPDGWCGHILPFEIVQENLLADERNEIIEKEERLAEIEGELTSIIDEMTEEEKDKPYLKDDNSAFVSGELNKEIKDIIKDVETDETKILDEYVNLLNSKAKKEEKLSYIKNHAEVTWANMEAKKDGTYGKGTVNKYIKAIKSNFEFPEDSIEKKLIKASDLFAEKSDVEKQIKEKTAEIHELTKAKLEGLSEEEAINLLKIKWITPMLENLGIISIGIINKLISGIEYISKKYETTYSDIENGIQESSSELIEMLGQLTGDEHDIQGLAEFKNLLGGE